MSSEEKSSYWITGASSGIGRAISKKLSEQGHRVYISGRNEDTLNEIIKELGGDLIAVPCDVSNDEAMATILQEKGIDSLNTVILCAGTCEYLDMPFIDVQKIRRVIETNLFGVVNACSAALPLLKKACGNADRKPHIIGIGSMSSYVGFPRAEAYGTSKAAMSYFLDCLHIDMEKDIDVTVVYPGFIETPMTDQNDFPMPFLMSAEKAADIILKKAGSRPRTIAFPTRLHLILRMMNVLPRLWYSVVAPRLSRQTGAES